MEYKDDVVNATGVVASMEEVIIDKDGHKHFETKAEATIESTGAVEVTGPSGNESPSDDALGEEPRRQEGAGSLLGGKSTLSVPLSKDAEGFIGRECPECERYFKIKPGTGLPGVTDCRCPYCNNAGPGKTFTTKEQIAYAKSVAMNAVSVELIVQLKKLERKPDPNAFLSLGITVKGDPSPITPCTEKDLGGHFTCPECTLEYAIEGESGFCPDCGVLNSL